MKSEAYLDIVWRQFKKNRLALVALWLLAPLFLLAIFAPLIASDRPFVFHDGEQTIYPWVNSIFHPEEPVDFAFNMAMLAFVPWAIVSLGLNAWLKRRAMPGRRRLGLAFGLYALLIVGSCAVFSNDALSPGNAYWSRTFTEEQFQDPEQKYGIYPPVPFGPTEQDVTAICKPPLYSKPAEEASGCNESFVHLLGTDSTGRDVLVEMIYGTRISLTVGFVAVGIYISIGVVVGAVAGYFGGMTDMLISRIIETVMLFPAFFLIMTLVALVGPSIYIIMVVIGLTRWAPTARLVRGEVLKQRAIDYVAAARAMGTPHRRIIFRHILPNSLSPVMVTIPFGVAGAIIVEAGLSLLGFGVRPPTPSWGTLLKLGNENYHYWWLVIVPSIAIFFTVTIFNLVGSGMRDAMDPRLRM
ncbi:MAG: ABC transporter permease [Planctomycetota bacterium]|nr:ABC transporter permease [Planctomycetota bacterium]